MRCPTVLFLLCDIVRARSACDHDLARHLEVIGYVHKDTTPDQGACFSFFRTFFAQIFLKTRRESFKKSTYRVSDGEQQKCHIVTYDV